ncbi:MAG: type IIA DNA topoisomerase subunit B, partial [Bdellovibrionales bacterium]|nr:type IIA DNA topoisomerase subunit B [Bdellovibrionales bacterium]
MASSAVAKSYSASDIEVLEGLEPVRKRPGMYIAGTDTPAGLHQLVFEILDNSVDEAMNGYADEITVTLHADQQSATVRDNGRGIPVDTHPRYKKPALELILTTLHAGGKFSDKNYKTAGGLHGVGSSVVNALSEEMIATVTRDGAQFEQRFSRGKPMGTLRTVKKSVRGSGTEIFFRPDSQIFPTTTFSAKTIRDTMQTKAYLNPGLRLRFVDEASGQTEEFCYEEGIKALLAEKLANQKSKVIGEAFFIERIGTGAEQGVAISLAIAWTESTSEQFFSFVNGIHTIDGGSHEAGAKSGIIKAVRNYFAVHDVQTKNLKIGAEDIREGLYCAVSVKLPGDEYQPQFQGQTKSRLNNPEVAPLVDNVARSLEQVLNETPSSAEAIVQRILLAARARAASRAAGQEIRRKVGISHRLTLPGKLADCSSTRPDETELFIVEGDSAGGSTKQGRDREFQAVLPLRGKVLNTIASSSKKVAENKELSNIIAALGCGSGDRFDVSKLRYGKVIILTDADADGMHIGTLLLAFFFTHMRPLIEQGCLYLGKPPLYGVFSGSAVQKASGKGASSGRKGKRKQSAAASGGHWAYSDEELQEVLAGMKGSPRIVRYKGLGEMNPETLWETTLDPAHRTLLCVRVEDEALVQDALKALMGSDPSLR